MSGRGLVVLHIDGLGYDRLLQGVADGRMPHVASLLAGGYTAQPYRCGVPSTTPYCQAGILYGDNREIPGFRWWDRATGRPVSFSGGSTFELVADRYFHDCEPLIRDGACIAAIFPAGARERFGLLYDERKYGRGKHGRSAGHVIRRFVASPIRVADFFGHAAKAIASIVAVFLQRRLGGRNPALSYTGTDILEEVFVHHLTRFAVRQALAEGYPVVYAGFYAYDETSHAFGPDDPFSEAMLHEVDASIRRIHERIEQVRSTGRDYELVVLSDHGHVPMKPFHTVGGKTLLEVLSANVPGREIVEIKGKDLKDRAPGSGPPVVLAASGGLAHVYLGGERRLGAAEVEAATPGLAEALRCHPGVAFVLTREAAASLPAAELAEYDDAEILVRQLRKLLSFETAGDLVVIAGFDDGRQLDFEGQAGGHGSIGGEQLHPFLLSRAELRLDASGVEDASEMHPILIELRDRLGCLA